METCVKQRNRMRVTRSQFDSLDIKRKLVDEGWSTESDINGTTEMERL